MSQTVSLASGTWLRLKNYFVQLAGTASVTFPDANNLDDVAGILSASNTAQSGTSAEPGKPTISGNLKLNTAALNRQEVAAGIPNVVDGHAIDITYDNHGGRINTDKGVPPVAPTALVQTAAPGASVIRVTFAVVMNSALNDYKTGFSVKVAGVARTINSAALQGGNLAIDLTLASPVTTGQAVLLSFDATLSDIKNAAGAKPVSFTDLAVTNTI